MRKLIILISFISVNLSAQINFFQGKWSDALILAQKENKKIFVDFYAVWCAPCKAMDKTTFTDKNVADYYNTNFINLKIDAEREEAELIKKIKIEAYPTLAYFNNDGTLLYLTRGAYTAEDFIQIGKNVMEFNNNKKKYANQKNNATALFNYLQILHYTDTATAIKIAEDYLNTLKDEDYIIPQNWHIIKYFGQNPHSRWFNYIIKNVTPFLNEYNENFYNYFTQTSSLILKKAVNEKDYSLTEKYKEIARDVSKQLTGNVYPGLDEEVDMYYYIETGDLVKYLETNNNWLNSYYSENVEKLTERSVELAEKYPNNALVLEYALKWSMKALAQEDSFYTNLIVSHIYRLNKQYTQALNYIDAAIHKARPYDDIEYAKIYKQEILDEKNKNE